MESDCLISNYLSDLDCDTITAFTPAEYALHANCRFLHSPRLLAGEDIPGVVMHKIVGLIVSLFPNSAVNSLCYTYIQIYVRVALTLALIFITVPKPRGQIHSIRSHYRWLWIRDNYKRSVTTYLIVMAVIQAMWVCTKWQQATIASITKASVLQAAVESNRMSLILRTISHRSAGLQWYRSW
jgi:hypothetical protein